MMKLKSLFALALIAGTLLVCGCGDSNFETGVVTTQQTVSQLAGQYAGQDLGQPGQLNLTVDSAGNPSGQYIANANHALLAPGSYPLSGELDSNTGFFRLSTPERTNAQTSTSVRTDFQIQGNLPTVDGAQRTFSLHAAGGHSGGLVLKGVGSSASTFEGSATLEIQAQNSNVAPLNNPSAAALLRSGPAPAVNQYLTIQIRDYSQEARMLTLHVNSGSSPLAVGTYGIIPADPTRPQGFFAFLNEGRLGAFRTWNSNPALSGEVTITQITANQIQGSYQVTSMEPQASSGAVGTFSCNGDFVVSR